LRQAVWGGDTFVDFDGGLNYCIAQIRTALGDSADSPRFVRTIPKRGYQFVAPVERPVAAASSSPQRSGVRYLAIALLAIPICGLAALALAHRHRPVNIAVVRFDNETGQPEMTPFADGLTDMVVADLTKASGGQFGIIGNAALLRRPRAEWDLTAIGSSLHAKYVILGQVQRSSLQTRVLAHLIRVPEQTHIDVVRFDRAVGDPLQTETELSRLITTEFLRRLGSSQEVASR
jgi:TolB-like protein